MQIPEYRNDYEDKWFHWKGVAPPQRTSHGVTSDNLEDLMLKNKHKCLWKQEGPNIVCREAPEFDHGNRIGINKRLVKTGDQGEPILMDIIINK